MTAYCSQVWRISAIFTATKESVPLSFCFLHKKFMQVIFFSKTIAFSKKREYNKYIQNLYR